MAVRFCLALRARSPRRRSVDLPDDRSGPIGPRRCGHSGGHPAGVVGAGLRARRLCHGHRRAPQLTRPSGGRMTPILLHELATQAPPLLERLRAVLSARPDRESDELLARAVFDERSTPRMVVTGQFSSGKSSLVRALTDGAADVVIDSDIATDEVTEYTWDGAVTLIDTPGVQAGVREHDRLAEEAISTADFVLFVITVDLLDDASRRFLRHLALDLGKVDQLLVIITHAAT